MKNLAAVLLCCCMAPAILPGQEQQPQQNKARLVAAINKFSVHLYQCLAQNADNLCLSPASVYTNLLMVNEGARGKTGAEIDKVLCLTGADADTGDKPALLFGEARRSAVAALLERLVRPANKEKPVKTAKPKTAAARRRLWRGLPSELWVLNAMWGQKDHPFLKDYVRTLSRTYRATVDHVDFVGHPGVARDAINTWVARESMGKIKDVVPRDDLDPGVRMVLANVIYFRGRWTHDFADKATKLARFHLEGGQPVRVPTMHQRKNELYFEDDAVQALQLGYVGDCHAMVFLLPRKGTKLQTFEKTLTSLRLRELLSKLAGRRVDIALPKFRFGSGLSLVKPLKGMGMKAVFDPRQADLSGISHVPLYVSRVLHKTHVEVHEEGTEAAGAAVTYTRLCRDAELKPVPFHANRPFLFLIRDLRTGLILFMGRVVDPRSES